MDGTNGCPDGKALLELGGYTICLEDTEYLSYAFYNYYTEGGVCYGSYN